MTDPSPAASEFLVPDLGEGLSEVTVVEWLIPLNGPVEINSPLCVVETAKATVEIPSPYAGLLVGRGGVEGETLAVGSLLARIEAAGGAETASEPHLAPSGRTPTLVGYGADDGQDRSRRRRASASVSSVARADTSLAAESASTSPSVPRASNGASGPLAKPPVRRLARDLHVDLAAIASGSGPGGIITRADVLAAAQSAGARPDVPEFEASAFMDSAQRRPAGAGTGRETVDVPVRGIRARIADRMVMSRSRIPDATCSLTVDCTAVLDLRRRMNAKLEGAGMAPVITPLALISRMVVHALVQHPALNSSFLDDGQVIRIHGNIHLGIATATDRGLLVPVVKSAHALETLRLAQEISRLAEAARAGTTLPAELTGSTFTISNFGALGIEEGIPVINYPEAAILGLGSIRLRPVVSYGEIVARPTATMTCAFDHRVADGSQAAGFLRDLASLIEEPEMLVMHA